MKMKQPEWLDVVSKKKRLYRILRGTQQVLLILYIPYIYHKRAEIRRNVIYLPVCIKNYKKNKEKV